MEKNNQSVGIKSLSKEQRAALMAQLQQEEKEDRIARRETYEALRGEFMHEVKTNVLEMVNAVTGDRKSTRLNSSHRHTSRMPSSA